MADQLASASEAGCGEMRGEEMKTSLHMQQGCAPVFDHRGVISVKVGYVHSTDGFDFVGGVFGQIRPVRTVGGCVGVFASQVKMGRGCHSTAKFHKLTACMRRQILRRGGLIANEYLLPGHLAARIAGSRRGKEARQPRLEITLDAQRPLSLSRKASFPAGNELRDIHAGVAEEVGINIPIFSETHLKLEGRTHPTVSALTVAIPCLEGGEAAPVLQ